VESIDIFQFADDKDLLAVLIHEMGHALGLAHATNPNAIMYPKLVNQSTSITPDDIALFQTTCVK
jgi:predicted Zn-dependent protease